jgi:hypothetical protein
MLFKFFWISNASLFESGQEGVIKRADREAVTVVESIQTLLFEGTSFSFVIDAFPFFCFFALDVFPFDPVDMFPVDPLDFFPPFFDPFTLRSTLNIASVS